MRKLGQYELLGEIARGGMGVVYRARGPQGEVAIKLLLTPAADPRFQQEASAALRLVHPGVVRTHALERDERGCDYIVMELVEGGSLHQRIHLEGPLSVAEAIGIARQLCEAVEYAHGQSVLHRDLKPHNVLLDASGRAKLTDFGLGKIMGQSQGLTKTGEAMGTPGYMPPEQVEGEKGQIGPRSDVYSLGATLYATLTGLPPFRKTSTINTLYAVLKEPAPPPSALRSDVSADLDRVVLRCLAKDPDDRYASAANLEADLARLLRDRVAATTSRTTRVAAAIAVVGCLAAGGILWAGSSPAEVLGITDPDLSPSEVAEPSAPDPPDFRKLGVDHMTAKRYEEAFQAFEQALALEPERADLYWRRGLARTFFLEEDAALKRAALAEVLEDVQRATDLDPDRHEPYSVLARVRSLQGDQGGAVEAYTGAVVRAPPSQKKTFLAARAYRRLLTGDPRGAVEDYDQALPLATHTYRVQYAWALGDASDDRCWDVIQEVLDGDPTPSELAYALNRRAQWHIRSSIQPQGAELALKDLDEAIKHRENYDDYYHRALANYKRGNIPAAQEDARQMLALKGTSGKYGQLAEQLQVR